VSGETGDILNQHKSRPQRRDVFGHYSQNLILLIRYLLVVVPVADLAETLAWRAGCKQFDPTELAAFRTDPPNAIRRDQITFRGYRLGSVVVVNGNGGVPRIIGVSHSEAERPQADPDPSQAGTKFDSYRSAITFLGRPR
jgi:hypothetical protein